jgi:hypothetical protein
VHRAGITLPPYDENPNAALQQLRDDVFESGSYGDPFGNVSLWTQVKDLPFGLKLIVVIAKGVYLGSRFASWVARGCRSPGSIDEAVAWAGESGTHSILDIERCSQTPDFGVAWQLQPAIRRRLYGTEQPTAEDLARVGWHAAAENLDRWQAVYFPLYEDGNPVSLVFVGCSGD